MFGADPFLCLVYVIGGGVLQWIFVTICYAILLHLKYRGSKIPGRSGGRVQVCSRKLGNSSSSKADRMQAASSDFDAVHSYCKHIPDTPTQQPTCRAKKKQSTSLLQRLLNLRSPISPRSEWAFFSSMYHRQSVCPPPVSMESDCSSYPTCSSVYEWPSVAAINQETCFESKEFPSPFPIHSKPDLQLCVSSILRCLCKSSASSRP